jgi:hypothetical protein
MSRLIFQSGLLLLCAVGVIALLKGSLSEKAHCASPAVSHLSLMENISIDGTTWRFGEPVPVGRFINGDCSVVGAATIVNINSLPAMKKISFNVGYDGGTPWMCRSVRCFEESSPNRILPNPGVSCLDWDPDSGSIPIGFECFSEFFGKRSFFSRNDDEPHQNDTRR